MAVIFPTSCSASFLERFRRLVKDGERSELIVKLVSEELDKREGIENIKRKQDLWFRETVIPTVRDCLKGYSFRRQMDFIESQEERKLFAKKLLEREFVIDDDTLRKAVLEVVNE